MEIPGIQLVERIGSGGMAQVYRAWDFAHERVVAVKVLDVAFSQDRKDLSQFREEERLLAEIRHPGIVEGYGLYCVDGYWLMAMEYVDGYTFAKLLKRKRHIAESDCLLIVESVAAALSYAWERHRTVHCDIKPENIMINTEGVVKITDLGLAERFHHKGDTAIIKEAPDHVTGTPAYISPEQVYGDRELDWRTDVYSLGATVYHLATGSVLFPGLDTENSIRAHCNPDCQAPDPRTLQPELTEGFVRLLERMLVKERTDRRWSWGEIFQMARQVEAGGALPPRENAAVSSLRLA